MSQDNCPRCGASTTAPKMRRILQSMTDAPEVDGKFYECGSYDILIGGFRESELCETRQELQSLQNGLIAELCPCGRADGYECEQHSFNLLMRVRETKARAEKAEAELAAIKSLFEDIKTIPAPKFDKRKRRRK